MFESVRAVAQSEKINTFSVDYDRHLKCFTYLSQVYDKNSSNYTPVSIHILFFVQMALCLLASPSLCDFHKILALHLSSDSVRLKHIS